MQQSSALPSPAHLPGPGRPDQAATGIERWLDAADRSDDPELARFAAGLAKDEKGRALLEAIFGNSPFLGRCLLLDMKWVFGLLGQGVDATFSDLVAVARAEAEAAADLATLMSVLRIFKRRAALLIALADISAQWTLEQVTAALTEIAELALDAAAGHLLRAAAATGAIALADEDRPQDGSGLIILGMGKLGGRELNYSSDIDLIVMFDEERVQSDRPEKVQQVFVRLTRDLVRAMEERTADGYVFRTDLRIRPDPGATPLALSTLAAETYYESLGQNWERAAMIKARPVAGDISAGAQFLARLRPFLWRKNLDFAAIQDIHSIKRQINAHRGGGRIAVAGHNIKLGRGGIREVEFFVQTQQLIWGGREPRLRAAATCDALRALAEVGRVEPEVADDLIASYRYLRGVEHRLQMVDDEQTHVLPADEDGLAAFAVFLGYPGREAFADDLLLHLRRVEEHYARLFEESAPLAGPGNLVFTGGEHDPDTLATLARLGYPNPEAISSVVRGWHHGRYRATRSTRARELLTELMPALLSALARTANPEAAFLKFDEFLASLPAGVQLFSMFHARPELLDLVAEIMGGAPQMAERMGRNPNLFEAVLSQGFFEPQPAAAVLADDLQLALGEAADFQDVLDIVRRWNNDRRFQAAVHILRGVSDAEAAGAALSDIADVAVGALQPEVERDFAARHGRVAGGGLAVLALGKLGGRELTVTSDLDLIFIYEVAEGAEASDGAKPLAPGHYFARLSQRFLNAITAPTPEGRLYEVDMRLRPSGKSGPIASQLDAFVRYQQDDAWTWEHMALTRARVICGPPELSARATEAVRGILVQRRDADRLRADIADMRARVAREHEARTVWHIKHQRGGLMDIEFIAQYLQLRHAAAHPEVLAQNTTAALQRLADTGVLEPAVAGRLVEATGLWRRVQGMLRLASEERFDEEAATEGLRALLVRAGQARDFADLKARMAATAAEIFDIFQTIVGEPSGKGDT